MTRAALPAFAIALLMPAFAAQMRSVTRDGKKIDFVECEKCEMLAKWNASGTYATINLSRLRDGNPSAEELSRREAETLERVLAAMSMRKDVVPKGWTEVPLRNDSDSPRDYAIQLKSLGLQGTVHALDMTDRAMLPDQKDALAVLVPPRETKVYRLFPKTR